jgi:hypothetical protein
MSFDLNLNTTCDHLVYRELQVLGSDRRIIRTDFPIAATNTVKVYATGNLISSSYYIITDDPNPPPDAVGSKVIYFKDKWKALTDYFEINYLSLKNYCTKCVGSGYLDDISYNIRGSLPVLRDEYLLMQNVEKFTITKIKSNPFQSFIGTALESLIGTKITSPSFIITQITAEISRTLRKLQDLQSQYLRQGRPVTNGEILQSIEGITVTQNTTDPTVFEARVIVTAASGKTVEFTQVLKIRA